jgi:hypothetical protein
MIKTDGKGHLVHGILAIYPSQNITVSAGASVVISSDLTKPFIRVACDVACYINIGGSAVSSTATTSMLLPAGAIDYLQVGEHKRVSGLAYSATGGLAYSATGVLSVTEID